MLIVQQRGVPRTAGGGGGHPRLLVAVLSHGERAPRPHGAGLTLQGLHGHAQGSRTAEERLCSRTWRYACQVRQSPGTLFSRFCS